MSSIDPGPFAIHVFVCTSGKVCPRQGAEEVAGALRRRLVAEGLQDRVRINKCGCMAQCGYGPMVCVYPQNHWYSEVRVEDVDALFDAIVAGEPHEPLLYRNPLGGKRICPAGEEPIPPRNPAATGE